MHFYLIGFKVTFLLFTFAGVICLFGGCFGDVVWVGFAGSAGFKGDFDNDFSSTSCVVRPAAKNKTDMHLLVTVLS